MIVYALIFTRGISTGYKTLIGIYSSAEKAEEIKKADIKKNAQTEWHYSIVPIKIDKTINEVYVEW